MHDHYIELTLADICQAVELPEQVFVELVKHDIVCPTGEQASEWSFDVTMVSIARRAVRLHRDLELDWPAIAVIVDLIEQRDRLQSENELLRQRLSRFLE